MRFFRRCIADRFSGGVIAAVTAYMLVLNALVGCLTCSMSAAGAGLAADFVICSPAGSKAQPGSPPGGGSHCHCPCGLVCQIGGLVLAAVAPGGIDAPAVPGAAAIAGLALESQTLLKSAATGRLGEPRAPPVLPV